MDAEYFFKSNILISKLIDIFTITNDKDKAEDMINISVMLEGAEGEYKKLNRALTRIIESDEKLMNWYISVTMLDPLELTELSDTLYNLIVSLIIDDNYIKIYSENDKTAISFITNNTLNNINQRQKKHTK